MSEEVENKLNDSHFKNQLFNYLINYITENRNRNRNTTCIRVNPEVFNTFVDNCYELGLHKHRGISVVIEALLSLFNETFKTRKFVQTTLFCYKPEIRIQTPKVELNIATKLEVKIVKNELKHILIALEQGKNPDFWLSKLKDSIAKAIRVYDKTRDSELEELLKKSEKWIEKIYRRNF